MSFTAFLVAGGGFVDPSTTGQADIFVITGNINAMWHVLDFDLGIDKGTVSFDNYTGDGPGAQGPGCVEKDFRNHNLKQADCAHPSLLGN